MNEDFENLLRKYQEMGVLDVTVRMFPSDA